MNKQHQAIPRDLRACALLAMLTAPAAVSAQGASELKLWEYNADSAVFFMGTAASQVEEAADKLDGFRLALAAAKKKKASRKELKAARARVEQGEIELEKAYLITAALYDAYSKDKSKVWPADRKTIEKAWKRAKTRFQKSRKAPPQQAD